MSDFNFRRGDEENISSYDLNLSKFANVDISAIIHEKDFSILEENLSELVYGDVSNVISDHSLRNLVNIMQVL